VTGFQILFYLLAVMTVLSAVLVISSPNPVRGALFLVLTFVMCAGLWILLEAEFLGLILVLVYVGAVMTLFLFVVMMIHIEPVPFKQTLVRYLPIGLVVVLMILGMLLYVILPEHFGFSSGFQPAAGTLDQNNIRGLGEVLYTHYVYPFEIAGVLLLVSIVAAISLSYRGPVNRLGQVPGKQVYVDPKDRLRVVDMPSEKKI